MNDNALLQRQIYKYESQEVDPLIIEQLQQQIAQLQRDCDIQSLRQKEELMQERKNLMQKIVILEKEIKELSANR